MIDVNDSVTPDRQRRHGAVRLIASIAVAAALIGDVTVGTQSGSQPALLTSVRRLGDPERR